MRTVARVLFCALALILLGLALTPTVSPAQGTVPCDPSFRVPYWWHLRPPEPCGGDSATLVFGSCKPCVDILGYRKPDLGPLELDVRAQRVCPASLVCFPDTVEVPLGRLVIGRYALHVLVNVSVMNGDSVLCQTTQLDSVAFTIGCPEPPPPPPDSLLPFVSRIRIGDPALCRECPSVICPFRPIPLHLAGAFPSTCYRFKKLELLPSMILGPRAEPPIVRIVVEVNDCMKWACADVTVPWWADALLPALPPGPYVLPLQLAIVSMCDSTRVDTMFYASRPFTVGDSCHVIPPGPCVWADWEHKGGRCDDFIGPGGRAKATMTITSSVPLAGLEGQLSLWPQGLLITNLEPVGAAEGMRIAWQRTPDGAKFLMFAERGAPIGGQRITEPVLAVGMVKDTDAVLAPVTHLSVAELLGADSLGRAVPQCKIMTLVVVEARICSGPTCDFNGDGHLDVRDLVTMVHCILGSGPCPDTTSAGLDCNGDGRLGVDDVLCCARVILHGGERDTVPGRPEPGVTVELGEPAWSADGLHVPFALVRADRVGAARLVLDYPSDRYDVVGVELGQSAPEWLVVHEVVEGKVVVGVIGLGAGAGGDETPTLALRLRLKAKLGTSGGGSVTVVDQQFSGRDGVTLEVPANTGAVSLPEAGRLGLSAARPNPFADETHFGLNLERGAEAEVGIYDLSGRRVTVLHHGPLGAGPHEFTWRGERSDGARARAGVYFVQARVGSEKLTRKVVFLRGD
jgi:hypothetical protein